MGGCNSVFSELAGGPLGVLVGAGVAGFVADAAGVPLPFTQKKGCSKSKAALVQATREVVSSAIVTSLTQCSSFAQADQSTSITCMPRLPAGTVYEGNAACGSCNGNVFDGMMAGHAQERAMWDKGEDSEVRVRLPIDEEFKLLMARVGSCGLTTCKACSLANVTQYNILNADMKCYAQMRDTTVFQNNLSTIVKQQLLANQDVLAGVARALGSGADVINITEKITSSISSHVTQDFLNTLSKTMSQSQTITIVAGGSFFGNNISQNTAFTLALEAVTEADIVNKAISDGTFAVMEQVINEQNTLNSVGAILFTSTITFATALDSIVGKVMIAVLVALGVVLLFLASYAMYKMIKQLVSHNIEDEKQTDLSQMTLSGFERY